MEILFFPSFFQETEVHVLLKILNVTTSVAMIERFKTDKYSIILSFAFFQMHS